MQAHLLKQDAIVHQCSKRGRCRCLSCQDTCSGKVELPPVVACATTLWNGL